MYNQTSTSLSSCEGSEPAAADKELNKQIPNTKIDPTTSKRAGWGDVTSNYNQWACRYHQTRVLILAFTEFRLLLLGVHNLQSSTIRYQSARKWFEFSKPWFYWNYLAKRDIIQASCLHQSSSAKSVLSMFCWDDYIVSLPESLACRRWPF